MKGMLYFRKVYEMVRAALLSLVLFSLLILERRPKPQWTAKCARVLLAYLQSAMERLSRVR